MTPIFAQRSLLPDGSAVTGTHLPLLVNLCTMPYLYAQCLALERQRTLFEGLIPGQNNHGICRIYTIVGFGLIALRVCGIGVEGYHPESTCKVILAWAFHSISHNIGGLNQGHMGHTEVIWQSLTRWAHPTSHLVTRYELVPTPSVK